MVVNELKTTIDRFEGEYAVLSHRSDQILWPKDKLPEGSKEGDILVLVAKRDEDARKDRESLAKTVINELLSGD